MKLDWNFQGIGRGDFKLKDIPWEGHGYFLAQYIKQLKRLQSQENKSDTWFIRLIYPDYQSKVHSHTSLIP